MGVKKETCAEKRGTQRGIEKGAHTYMNTCGRTYPRVLSVVPIKFLLTVVAAHKYYFKLLTNTTSSTLGFPVQLC